MKVLCQMISWSIKKVFKVFVSGLNLELEPDPQWHVSPEIPTWVGFNYSLFLAFLHLHKKDLT